MGFSKDGDRKIMTCDSTGKEIAPGQHATRIDVPWRTAPLFFSDDGLAAFRDGVEKLIYAPKPKAAPKE